jgi:hypothetical protein
MSDLVVGYAVIAASAVVVFLVSVFSARGLSPRALDLATLLVVAGLFFYIRQVWYQPVLAEWLPFSNLIVIGNWLPLFSAAIAGLAWQRTAAARERRPLTLGALGICALVSAVYPVLGTAPRCDNRWDNLETCLQTAHQTCSAACAATLLRRHGIAATEQEMAELCLTRRGTSWQGLYRGLKLKTADSDWDVQVCQCSVDDLERMHSGPLILSVGLPADEPVNSEFSREFGWVPGVNHSVVLESYQGSETAVISDPSQEMSREHWDRDMLDTLFRGTVVRLTPRQR